MAYKLESISYEFARISTADALQIRKIMMDGVSKIQADLQAKGKKIDKAKDDDFDISAMSDILAEIEPFALKYLVIINPDGSRISSPEITLLESFFENPFMQCRFQQSFLRKFRVF